MLDYIKGVLARADVTGEEVIIEQGGIGFRITVSRRYLDTLGLPGSDVRAFVELLIINEREMKLFGFSSELERELFRLICKNVKNVGPVTAMKILGAGSVLQMKSAIANNEYSFFSSVKGIGGKTSERIVRELKDAVRGFDTGEMTAETGHAVSDNAADAVKTLIALGVSERAAYDKVNIALENAEEEMSVEELVKQVLQGN
jgi:Holliday junction DNA helicase RuvA